MAQCKFMGLGHKNKWRNWEQRLAASQTAAPNYEGGNPGSIQLGETSRSDT